MEICITKRLKWKVSPKLLLDEVYEIALKWDNFTERVSLIDVHFLLPHCPYNLGIIESNILKLVYHTGFYDFDLQLVALALLYLSIRKSVLI